MKKFGAGVCENRADHRISTSSGVRVSKRTQQRKISREAEEEEG
jgi:hypothetical protein